MEECEVQMETTNPFEFMGKTIFNFRGYVYQKDAQEAISELELEQVRDFLGGYLRAAIDAGDGFRAYKLIEEDWAKYVVPDREELTFSALECAVLSKYAERHNDRSFDHELFEGLALALNFLVGKYPRIKEIARAAEKNHPALAMNLYTQLKEYEEVERFAKEMFNERPSFAFRYMSDDETRLQHIQDMLEWETLTPENYVTLYLALNNTSGVWDKKIALYKELTKRAEQGNPDVAFAIATEVLPDTDLAKRMMQVKIERGTKHFYEYSALINKVPALKEDKSLWLQLAMAFYPKVENSRYSSQECLGAFRTAGYEGKEKTECLRVILSSEETKSKDYGSFTQEELVAGAEAIMNENPDKALNILRGLNSTPKVQEQMRVLAGYFLVKKDYLNAYFALIAIDDPKVGQLDSAITGMIAKSSYIGDEPYVPSAFFWFEDAGAMISWYATKKDELSLDRRYERAHQISKRIEDDSLVQPLREELIQTDFARARASFIRRKDEEGMQMLVEYMFEQHPELREYSTQMIRVLGLEVKEK